MKIAVSYDVESGNVFDHFGHAPAFKMYEVEDGNVIANNVVIPNGMGHTVMVNLMKEHDVNAVICGRIGGHALDGLKELGINAYIVGESSADEAVQAFLRGELEQELEGSACHHDHGCGCGGHQEPQILYPGKNAGKKVAVHYTGTLNDGTKFDSSLDRGEPLSFICGIGMMIAGFDKAVADMEVGEETDIHLTPEEAYGPHDPQRVLVVKIEQLPGSETLEVGQRVGLQGPGGQPIPVIVTAKDAETITLDMNHEMAGKELNFHITLVSVEA